MIAAGQIALSLALHPHHQASFHLLLQGGLALVLGTFIVAFGMLGLADHVLVTEDSVSMVSEACATGRPVQTISLEGGTERLRAFHRGMMDDGHVRPFRGILEYWKTKFTNEIYKYG